MGYSKLKTRHVAQVSVQQFIWIHPNAYYWTFTVHDKVEDKAEALRRAKPLFDLIGRKECTALVCGKLVRRRCTYLAFWELQKRGSWHLHLLTSAFLDVNELRPWMVDRGWGPQMRVERVAVNHSVRYEHGWGAGALGVANVGNGGARLARYLTKYLTKSLDECPRKKAFSGSAAAKVGSIGFQWTPETNPNAYFFYYGRQLFYELYGRQPKFTEFREVCRLGYEATEWASRDPWSDPPG
jgi:hypothetical protein